MVCRNSALTSTAGGRSAAGPGAPRTGCLGVRPHIVPEVPPTLTVGPNGPFLDFGFSGGLRVRPYIVTEVLEPFRAPFTGGVGEREREGGRKRERASAREREREREIVHPTP